MKDREIYDYLNNVSTEYDDVKLSKFEIEKIKKEFNIKGKKNRGRYLAGLAAAFVLIMGIFALTRENVIGEISNMIEKFFTSERVELSHADNLPSDVKKYTVNLHETVTLNHISFVVEDVAIDGKYGYLNLIYPEKYMSDESEYIINNIYVNGKNFGLQTSESGEDKMENGLISNVMKFKLEREIPSKGEITLGIEFADFRDIEDKALLEFKISMDELTKDTKLYLQNFTVPGEEDYKIAKMIVNLFNPRIETTEPQINSENVSYKFIGTAADGRKIVFAFDNLINTTDKSSAEYFFIPKGKEGYKETSDMGLEEFYDLRGDVKFQMYRDTFETNVLGKRKLDSNGRPVLVTEKVGDEFTVVFR